MNKKIILTLIVLLFCVSCLSLVSADNSTNETSDNESVDMANYIMPISIAGNEIEFSDGFTGFCLDSSMNQITADDGFESQQTGSGEIQNYVKLAIIEAYKQGCEDELGEIIASFADGSYKSSNNKVIVEVLKSQENIGDNAVVELEDSIEGTFEFELLKSVNGNKSDCLAYSVSLKEIADEDKLGTAADDNATDKALANSSEDDKAADTADNASDEKIIASTDNKSDEKNVNTADNKTDEKANGTSGNEKQNQETIINETNKTIINKTKTVTINENNTTIINTKNTKIINKTNETPQNATIQDAIVKTVGNPIFILVVCFVILAAAGIYMRRKG